MRNKKIEVGTILVILIFLVIISLYSLEPSLGTSNNYSNKQQMGQSENSIAENKNIDKLLEDKSVYFNDKSQEIVNLYVTIMKSYDSDGKTVTLDDLNAYRYYSGEESPRVDVIFQEGDELGPSAGYYGYNELDANGIMQLRGRSTQSAKQKSYKIKLYDKSGLWKDQESINLNKHPFDTTKVRNKLSFDYIKTFPDMVSLRTTFVHLHIKDLTSGIKSSFEDFGLYTQVEQPNKRFLKMHGLDSNGNLYKAQMFEFLKYPDELKNADDKTYSKEDFEKVLEIKGSEDHSKLLKMLDDVNNYTLDINTIVDKSFDRDNYLTWMASNIIFGNIDVSTQNFYLYSPLNSDKWYFIPWDYDGAWGFGDEEKNVNIVEPWSKSISVYWGSVLHRRFLKDPKNIEALTKKIDELSKIVTSNKTKAMLQSYYSSVQKVVTKFPDLLYLGVPLGEYEDGFYSLVDIPQKNIELYKKNLENPMPVFLSEPKVTVKDISFVWDNSFDLQGDDLVYDFQVSRTPDFHKVIYEEKGIKVNNLSMSKLAPGGYYWRVIIKDSKGNTQIAFDTYQDVDDTKYFGIMKFKVE